MKVARICCVFQAILEVLLNFFKYHVMWQYCTPRTLPSWAKYNLKIINLPAGQIIDPSLGKTYSLPFLSANPSSLSRTGFLSWHGILEGSSASTHALLWNYRDTSLARYKNLRTQSRTTDANLNRAFLMPTFPIPKSYQNTIKLVTRPALSTVFWGGG